MRTRSLVAVFAGVAGAATLTVSLASQQPTPAPAPASIQVASVPSEPILSPGATAARYPATAAEFDAYFKKVKNWGRWGADDELGTAEPDHRAKRKQAAALVQRRPVGGARAFAAHRARRPTTAARSSTR